jgi:DNA-binding XRE family transcriptional regulator
MTSKAVGGNRDVPLAALIGRRLKELREAAGLRQDDVAGLARRVGWEWTAATVAAIETGRREVSLAEFLSLPYIGRMFPADRQQPRSLADFVGDAPLGELVGVLLSPDILTSRGEVFHLLQGRESTEQSLYSRGASERRIKARQDTHLDAERKAARRLGVSTESVVRVSRRLWGRTLTEERDERVARAGAAGAKKSTAQALRGHVTRELSSELAAALTHSERKRR